MDRDYNIEEKIVMTAKREVVNPNHVQYMIDLSKDSSPIENVVYADYDDNEAIDYVFHYEFWDTLEQRYIKIGFGMYKDQTFGPMIIDEDMKSLNPDDYYLPLMTPIHYLLDEIDSIKDNKVAILLMRIAEKHLKNEAIEYKLHKYEVGDYEIELTYCEYGYIDYCKLTNSRTKTVKEFKLNDNI